MSIGGLFLWKGTNYRFSRMEIIRMVEIFYGKSRVRAKRTAWVLGRVLDKY